jgi:hypothetical protein
MGNSDSTEHHYERRARIVVKKNGRRQTVYTAHREVTCQGLDYETRMQMLSDMVQDNKDEVNNVLPKFQRLASQEGARCYITYN